MNYDAPPQKPLLMEIRASVLLYRPDDLEEVERYGQPCLPLRTVTRYARWWAPLPARGDTVGIGSDPEYLTVASIEWWPADNVAIIETEPVRTDDPQRFRDHVAAFDVDGWLSEAQWYARQEGGRA